MAAEGKIPVKIVSIGELDPVTQATVRFLTRQDAFIEAGKQLYEAAATLEEIAKAESADGAPYKVTVRPEIVDFASAIALSALSEYPSSTATTD